MAMHWWWIQFIPSLGENRIPCAAKDLDSLHTWVPATVSDMFDYPQPGMMIDVVTSSGFAVAHGPKTYK